MFVWQAHERAVTTVAFGPDGQTLVSTGADECVKGWEPFSGTERFRISFQSSTPEFDTPAPLRCLTLSADGGRAAFYHQDRLVFLDLARERVTDSVSLARFRVLKRTPDGAGVVALIPGAHRDGTPEIQLRDYRSRLVSVVRPDDVRATARAMAFSPDGTRIAIGRQQFRWPASGDRGSWIDTKKLEPEDLAFSANNEHLFARVGGKVVVYSLFTGLFKTKLKGHCGPITAMELAPDGRRLWTASRDATVKCWDTHALTLDRTFRFDTGGLDCLALSPDGNMAAVGSGQKGTITVWDLG